MLTRLCRRLRLCLLAPLVVAGVGLGAPRDTFAQAMRIEFHPLPSTTLTDRQVLTGDREGGQTVTLAGALSLPRLGNERLPAVVILNNSGGISGNVDQWARRFNEIGMATFIVDSFTGRGIVSTIGDQDQLGRLAMTVDAFRAFELLERHPRIDPDRIALMGFSRGGQAALYAGLKRLHRWWGPTSGREFAGIIGFYANCGTDYRNDTDVTDRPIRLFHGSADDYVPVAPCRTYVERLRAAGKDVALAEYPGAFHVFDWPALATPVLMARAQTTRHCRLEEAPDGTIIDSETRQPFTNAGDPCVERGATVAYAADALDRSIPAVLDFVRAILKPR